VLHDLLADAPDDSSPLGRGRAAPVGVLERASRGCDRRVYVLGVARGDVVDDLAERGVVDLERAGVTRVHPLAVDQHQLGLLEKPGRR
jgi:hypothetical protein